MASHGQDPTFWCGQCEAHVQLIVDGRHVLSDPQADGLTYVFGHCPRCESPGVVHQRDEGPYVDEIQIFPPEQRRLDFPLRGQIDVSYREALRCEAAEAWIATAVMVRRTLEAVSKDFDPSAQNLYRGLELMLKKGVISEEVSKWGHALRVLGNSGAHATEEGVSSDDAKEAVEFLSAIIETIYHLRPKFQAMMARHAAKAAAKAATTNAASAAPIDALTTPSVTPIDASNGSTVPG